jgi:hypothetical protein
MLINAVTFREYRDVFTMEYERRREEYLPFIEFIIETTLEKPEMAEYTMTDEEIKQTNDEYEAYWECTKKAREHETEMKYELEEKEERERKIMEAKEEQENEKTLKELVRKIEEMGWKVTLELKQ